MNQSNQLVSAAIVLGFASLFLFGLFPPTGEGVREHITTAIGFGFMTICVSITLALVESIRNKWRPLIVLGLSGLVALSASAYFGIVFQSSVVALLTFGLTFFVILAFVVRKLPRGQ